MEPLTKNNEKDELLDTGRLSTCSSPSSSYKMSIDSDDARSISSMSCKSSIKPYSWSEKQKDEVLFLDDYKPTTTKKSPKSSYDFRERPERRSVNRRSSLLPKSRALLRVMDQADEDTHLADVEMRREHETTKQLNKLDDHIKQLNDVPAASWTKVTDTTTLSPSMYQCSKLNPEIEMTNFQFENISHNNKSIKRKASEDRFEPYPTSMCMKRRAVSPSVSLNGSPVLSNMSSPPTSFSLYTSSNAATPTSNRTKPGSFNLQDASGGLSRMSISE